MATDWKDKYLSALEQEEKRERQYQQVMGLLIRAIVRISMVAEGVDQQLDKQLVGLRSLLREGTPSGRDLNTLVSALDGQVKRLEGVKSERAQSLAKAFQSLSKQLKELKPEKEAVKKLKLFDKKVKARSDKIYEYSPLIKELADIQKIVLTAADNPAASQPFWKGLFSSSDEDTKKVDKEKEKQAKEEVDKPLEPAETSAKKSSAAPAIEQEPAEDNDGLDLSDDVAEPREQTDPSTVGKEPPFSKYSQFIREVLTELLDQIDPPPKLAKENYVAARKQLAKELPWFELVPTLEDVVLVVISAFDQNQKEFEQYLKQLNERLQGAYEFIRASQQSNQLGAESAEKLNASMREQVSAMRESVNSATELDQLKSDVNDSLSQIVSAMDQYQAEEKTREVSLSEQLDALVERVKVMETDSQEAEKRIEEQRQKALRDVLTQLPNREAYQQRLEQEFERWQRYSRPLSMVVCDIDHFKKINDSYGHLAGDKVLRIIAKTLVKRLRKTDFVARYGGEEFVVLMPETNQQQAYKVVEGVREAIASCPFHFKEKRVSITMSFGVTEFLEGDGTEPVFSRADKALYKAKEKGRNCSILAD